jgi:hypothetical protein
VWHYANLIIQEEGEALETTATPQFTSALADMVYAQTGLAVEIAVFTIESLATDLESFASHAKRSIINVEDVKVLYLFILLTLVVLSTKRRIGGYTGSQD